jgi:hypothetical protein
LPFSTKSNVMESVEHSSHLKWTTILWRNEADDFASRDKWMQQKESQKTSAHYFPSTPIVAQNPDENDKKE